MEAGRDWWLPAEGGLGDTRDAGSVQIDDDGWRGSEASFVCISPYREYREILWRNLIGMFGFGTRRSADLGLTQADPLPADGSHGPSVVRSDSAPTTHHAPPGSATFRPLA